jgi:hypothetical protein
MRNIARNGAPFLIGALGFLIVVGPRVLVPTNVAWLGAGDLATHYLGWSFFRNSPWTFPIGLNPTYGQEISNAILYSDSNPLMAFIFKPLGFLLPEPFQYFGIWLLACFCLQAWFGWKLVGLVTDSKNIQGIGAALFVFAPPFMVRLIGHLNLGGHFLVLAALYLVFSRSLKRRRLAWGTLMVVSALVHAYLLAMVALLWLASLVQEIMRRSLPARQLMLEFGVVSAVTGIACWQAGYFSVGDGVSGAGYGFYRMNLLSMLDPSGWSYVLKDIPERGGDYEGFNFLGLGVIFLALCAVPAALAGRIGLRDAIRKYPVLLMALAGLAVFAITNSVGLGAAQLDLPLPRRALDLAAYFRAAGRMFWPVFYAIVFAVIVVVVRGYGKRTAAGLLAVALAIQVIDTSAVWAQIRAGKMAPGSSQLAPPLADAFWKKAGAKYRSVRILPPRSQFPAWERLADYADKHALPTDAVYLARISTGALQRAQQQAAGQLATGRYDPATLYILDDEALHQAAVTLNANTDVLAKVDGFNVLAPGWKQCADCPAVAHEVNMVDFLRRLPPGERAPTRFGGTGLPYLLRGWSQPEEWGTWSDGDSAEIVVPVSGRVQSVNVEAHGLVTPAHPKQDLAVKVDGVVALRASLVSGSPTTLHIPLSRQMQEKGAATGYIRLRFDLPDAVQPKRIGLGADERKLALGLMAITLN